MYAFQVKLSVFGPKSYGWLYKGTQMKQREYEFIFFGKLYRYFRSEERFGLNLCWRKVLTKRKQICIFFFSLFYYLSMCVCVVSLSPNFPDSHLPPFPFFLFFLNFFFFMWLSGRGGRLRLHCHGSRHRFRPRR